MNRLGMNRFLAFVLALPVALTLMGAAVGDEVPALKLKDASGVEHVLDDSIRRVYFDVDRAGGEIVKAAMAGLDQSRLDAQHAAIIGDISEAPFFVKSLIKGGLKDRPYATWLDVSNATTALPRRPGQVAVIELEKRRIVAVRYAADADALRKELSPPAGALH